VLIAGAPVTVCVLSAFAKGRRPTYEPWRDVKRAD
jgi:hypothetical protein